MTYGDIFIINAVVITALIMIVLLVVLIVLEISTTGEGMNEPEVPDLDIALFPPFCDWQFIWVAPACMTKTLA